MSDFADKLRRRANRAEKMLGSGVGPPEHNPILVDKMEYAALARQLAGEHEMLFRLLWKFSEYTTSDIETTLKAEALQLHAATEAALGPLLEEKA